MQENTVHLLLPDLLSQPRCPSISREVQVEKGRSYERGRRGKQRVWLSCRLGSQPQIMALAVNTYNHSRVIPSEDVATYVRVGILGLGQGPLGVTCNSLCPPGGKQAVVAG